MDILIKLIRPLRGIVTEMTLSQKSYNALIKYMDERDILCNGNGGFLGDPEVRTEPINISILGIRIKKEI